ncbi:MAG: hypothetical protein COV45_08380 [Deltaproteobacteria bacterium CG11_big_fil_rev_8_21_14_0_20_47_16]|nr:MAG: hypothetical protein COV45_08380 [Deltaproteobacteria bacterium CG11_big_fil_rev_8_21_14_0_20_47_16]
MKRSMKWVAAAVVMAPFAAMAASQTLQMNIDGMTCGNCAAKVKKTLAPICKEVTVNLKAGTGTCIYDAPVTAEQVLAEAQKTGFTITQKK